MARLGIIAGSAFLEGGPPPGTAPRHVETDRGEVRVHVADDFLFLRRHGEGDTYRPPHRVRHHAHALALEQLGAERAVGLCSVGALHREIELGTAVVPEDYLSLRAPPTFAGDQRLHVVPELDGELRRLLLEVAREVGGPVRDGGVYAETAGPRFETRAEVRMLADYADVVGMTAGSEATLCQERGIRYAALGIVDNHAHGVAGEELSLEAFEEKQAENRGRARAALRGLVDRSRTLETDSEQETT
jgi:5'-methylthioadenosine phosphorylase